MLVYLIGIASITDRFLPFEEINLSLKAISVLRCAEDQLVRFLEFVTKPSHLIVDKNSQLRIVNSILI